MSEYDHHNYPSFLCSDVPSTSMVPLEEAVKVFQGRHLSKERKIFAEQYMELMECYESVCEAIYRASMAACNRLVSESKIPDFSNFIASPHSPNGLGLEGDLKRKFCHAMDRLQSSSLPKKHRGNLPKQAVETFKAWVGAHYNNPYPNEEEKLALSRETGVGVAQITNWFINHRKRVWRKNLPGDHPQKHSNLNRPFFSPSVQERVVSK